MPRSLAVSPDLIGTVKLALKRSGLVSQRALAEELELALSTVSNFLNGKPIDRAIFEEICSKLSLNWQEVAIPVAEPTLSPAGQDWGEAPSSVAFYGRTDELALLKQWIVEDQCHFVLVLGMGGTGKTALSVKLSEQISDRFDVFIWRSLRNAPPPQRLLSDLILCLSNLSVVYS